MLGKAETDQLRELCKRNCAANSDGTLSPGYFRIDAGDSAKKARKVVANITWGETDATASELLRRVEMVLADHRWVFVRAMPAGETHATDSLRLEGSPVPSMDGDDDDGPKGKDSAAEALARVAIGQMRSMEMMLDRNERLHDALQETQLKAGIYQYHAEALALSSKSELVTRAVETMGPQLLDQLPHLAAIWAAYQSGQPIPAPSAEPATPEDPAAAIGFWVDRMILGAQKLRELTAAHPSAAQGALPHLLRLRALVAQVAPLVGLRVVPVEAPPATPQGGTDG